MYRCAALLLFSCSLHAQVPAATSEQEQSLAAIRQHALNYSEDLPDFACTRVTERKDSPVILILSEPERIGTPQPNFVASTLVIEDNLIVSGQRESYKILKVDGKNFGHEMKLRPDQVVSTISISEFSSVLGRIFDPATGATIQWTRFGKLRGRPVLVFSFDVPRSHGERVYDRAISREVTVGYKGLLFADAESKAVLRVETHSSDFPTDSEFTGIDLVLDYKSAKIGGHEFVLPYRFDLQWHRHLPNSRTKAGALPQESNVQAEYKNCRGYAAQSAVSFEGDDVRSTITFGGIVSPEKQ